MMKKDVFLCHCSADKEKFARPFYNELKKLGVTAWFDEAEINIGDSLSEKIQYGLSSAKYFIVIATDNFLTTPYSYKNEELNAAIHLQINKNIGFVHSLIVSADAAKFANQYPFLSHRRYEEFSDRSSLLKWAKYYANLRDKSRRPLLLSRDEVEKELPTIRERIVSARSEVLISGNDCANIKSGTSHIEDALRNNVNIKIMCVAPDSAAAHMLPEIDPRFKSLEEFNNEALSFINDMKSKFENHKFPGKIEVRTIPILPALGFFIVDPGTSSGFTKVEIYTAREWKPMNTRPHLVFDEHMVEWRAYFLSQWDNYWALGTPVLSH